MPPKRWYGVSAFFAFTLHSGLRQVMPGDNVEMVGDLVHDVAGEVGSRYVI
jgi:translation elongation factor EF-Tu-like GTPase